MKKTILSLLLIIFAVSTNQASALVNTNLIDGDPCINFTDSLYMAKDTWLRTAAGYSNRDDLQSQSDIATKQVKRLHAILVKEGFTISKKEKSDVQFGRSTAIAVAGLQNKYKAELLTSQNLTYSYGVLDEKGVEFLNQKYGCLNKVSVKFQQAGKTIEAKINTEQEIGYVIAGVPNKVKVDFYVVNSANSETKISSVESKNGSEKIKWTPTVKGLYRIRAKINGTLYSEVQYNIVGKGDLSAVTTDAYWIKGDSKSQDISFTRSDLKGDVNVCLVSTDTVANGFIPNGTFLGSTEKSSITISDSKISDITNGKYKVLVTNSEKKCKSNTGMSAVSDVINIISKSSIIDSSSNTSSGTTGSVTTPTVTVTSPNGGEVWSKSTASRTVTWSTTNLTSSSNAVIAAVPMDDPINPYVLSNTTNSGSKTVSISSLPAGTYKIRVTVGSLTQDLSDTSFTITSN